MSFCLGPFCGKFHDELQGSSDEEEEDEGNGKKKNDTMRNPNRHKKKDWWGGTRKRAKAKEAESGPGSSRWPFSLFGESSGGGSLRWGTHLSPITVKIKVKNAQAATTQAMKLSVVNKPELPGSLNSVSQIPNLHTIEIIRCDQPSIPPGLPDMDTLAVLRMSHNRIRRFQEDLNKCNKIEMIVLDWNQISELPQGVFSPKSFPYLEVLNLAHNKLSILPPDFGLTSNPNDCHLKYIDLSYNSIEVLPEKCTQHCKNLEVLNLSHNCLKRLPRSFALKHLQRLFVSFNSLECLPDDIGECKELCKVRIISNQIRELPPSMINLWDRRGGKLEEFLPDKNPLVMPSITTFEMAQTNKDGINQAFQLFEAYLADEEKRKEVERKLRAHLEDTRAAPLAVENGDGQGALQDGQVAADEDAGILVAQAPAPVTPTSSAGLGHAEKEEFDNTYYFGHCGRDQQQIAEIRNAESTLMLVKKHMYVDYLVQLAEKEWSEYLETLDLEAIREELNTAKLNKWKSYLIKQIEDREKWLKRGNLEKQPREELPQNFPSQFLVDGFDATKFKDKVAVTDVDLYFNLLVMATKPMFSSCALLFDKFELGGKGYMSEEEWNEFCQTVSIQLDHKVQKQMWEIMSWRTPKRKKDSREPTQQKIFLVDFIAAWHIHDIENRDPWIARIAEVLRMDYYDMEGTELRRRLRAKDAADAAPDLDFDTKLGEVSFYEQLRRDRAAERKAEGDEHMDVIENPEGLRRIAYSPLEAPFRELESQNTTKESLILHGLDRQKLIDQEQLNEKIVMAIQGYISQLSGVEKEHLKVTLTGTPVRADIVCDAPHWGAMRKVKKALLSTEKLVKAVSDIPHINQVKTPPHGDIMISSLAARSAKQEQKDKLMQAVSLTGPQFADYEALIRSEMEGAGDSDAESLNSDNLSDDSAEDDSDFEAADFLQQRRDLLTKQQEAKYGKAIVVNSDESLQQLMDIPVDDFFRRSGSRAAKTSASSHDALAVATTTAPRQRKRAGNNPAMLDPKMKTDVFAVRQAMRRVYRNLPYHDFVKLINFLLRGLEQVKHSGREEFTYWHADDPTFKYTMGIMGTNKYTRNLLEQMGFVLLSDIYWVWPASHLDFAEKDVPTWGKTEVPTHCPGRDLSRLDDMICLLRSCHRSLNLKGSKFTGHFKTVTGT